MDRICKNCKFYDMGGECRAHAPIRLWIEAEPEAIGKCRWDGCWPNVRPNDWCGEFKEKSNG